MEVTRGRKLERSPIRIVPLPAPSNRPWAGGENGRMVFVEMPCWKCKAPRKLALLKDKASEMKYELLIQRFHTACAKCEREERHGS